MQAVAGHADAQGEMQTLVSDDDRLSGDALPQRLGDDQSPLEVRVRQQDQELLAAPTSDQVLGADAMHEEMGSLDQGLIADLVGFSKLREEELSLIHI